HGLRGFRGAGFGLGPGIPGVQAAQGQPEAVADAGGAAADADRRLVQAIANAVHHATGRRIRRLPIRLEDVA
ncbi:hypothetical protein MKK69_14730, partial [Methylobacterium sp. J-026]|uniref:hypothetical protein n=1 Tax=Methylobacterium sp. J-026 TaxID=2836624 RepID=UPI001FB868C6